MSHTVLDGAANLKYVYSLGAGTVGDPIKIVMQSYDHATIDDGVVYMHADRHTLANNGTFRYLIKTPSAPAHVELVGMTFSSTSAPLLIDLYEDAVISANGTPETLFNQNRQSTNSPGTLLYFSPTVTSNGTPLMNMIATGDKNIGGITSESERIILKQSSNYLIAILNSSGASANISVVIKVGED